jgi:predicted transposase YbfD/YdcC
MFDDIDRSVDDPRADNARHRLCDILILAFLGVMSGCDDYPGIVEFARDRQAWLKTFLPLPHGIPSVSTFRRVFAAVRPSVLTGLLQRWSGELAGTLAGKQIVLDGKTLRRSFDHAWQKDSALHVVTAWCVQDGLVLAQQAVEAKSNEITAVPEVLAMLDIKGAVVSVDALNTQTDIAARIIAGGGDYVMAVKDNHPILADSLRRHLDEMILENFRDIEHVYHETTDAGHGRIETRRLWATGQVGWLKRRGSWKKLASVMVVESVRRESAKAEPTVSRRYYISSLRPDSGRRLAELVRNHWSIENSQHWTLDVAFNEDQSRVRKDHGDQNLAVMRRLALGLLRRDRQVKVGARNKRLKAGRNPDYLLSVLIGVPMVK